MRIVIQQFRLMLMQKHWIISYYRL